MPFVATIKPNLKYLTTIDFGHVFYRAQMRELLASAALATEAEVPIAGHADSALQVARLFVALPTPPGIGNSGDPTGR